MLRQKAQAVCAVGEPVIVPPHLCGSLCCQTALSQGLACPCLSVCLCTLEQMASLLWAWSAPSHMGSEMFMALSIQEERMLGWAQWLSLLLVLVVVTVTQVVAAGCYLVRRSDFSKTIWRKMGVWQVSRCFQPALNGLAVKFSHTLLYNNYCVCTHVYHSTHVVIRGLPPYGSREQTQVFRLGCRRTHSLRHLSSPWCPRLIIHPALTVLQRSPKRLRICLVRVQSPT